ncbi:maleylacetoacetate isomerase [Sphingomonas oligophenolica]|uniref:Maleylacetoacetate isomerase n=1 Tax=Sphingomonas oligophenolica TaxID=301154 RepID=A0A502CDQ7_9SPHN|nr:maleylacetoacetate isomerase [Sphingomonas oligophenolica]TPG10812.1 maleylacetoacetate isomerase [Sphingomonas oligophenolica]
MILHGYWRSGAAYRVRIALGLKGLAYDQVNHDLRTGAQAAAGYTALNTQHLVPTLVADDTVLTQSSAILEWLEETHPAPPLLPADATARAIVRAMVAIIGADTHPLHNLRVLKALASDLNADPIAVQRWAARWIGDGFAALEPLIAQYGNGFAYADTPTLADCFLVPQLYSAERFSLDLTPYPRLVAAGEKARALPAFAAAHPSRQPDADQA